MPTLYRFCRQFIRDCRALALIEFALVFPILMLLVFGGLEIGRQILITQRVEKAGFVIADIVSRYLPADADPAGPGKISVAELTDNVFPQVDVLMGSYADQAQQAVIITSIVKEPAVGAVPAAKRIQWQIAGGGTLAGDPVVTSIVNGFAPTLSAGTPVHPNTTAKGTDTAFPADIEGILEDPPTTMPETENLLVVEFFYHYEPLWTDVFGSINIGGGVAQPVTMVKRIYLRPRAGDLICLLPNFKNPTICP